MQTFVELIWNYPIARYMICCTIDTSETTHGKKLTINEVFWLIFFFTTNNNRRYALMQEHSVGRLKTI